MPRPLPASRSVTAQTTKTPAYSAEVMNSLEPFRMKSSPSLTAMVFMPEGSEPAWGSVSPKAPAAYSPDARRDMCRAFCSSVPNSRMTSATILVTDMVTAVAAQARPISVRARL